MTLASVADGSQTAVISTEHTLVNANTDGHTYVGSVDIANLVAGDVLELYAKTKVRSVSSEAIAYSASYAHAQILPNVYTPPIPAPHSFTLTLKQVAGTGRAFPWKVLDLGNDPTESDEGSQTATIDTEHTLVTKTDGKTYVLAVDTSNMANGDRLILRVKSKIRTGDTLRTVYQSPAYQNVQGDSVKYSLPVPALIEWIATLEQVDGTGRAFPWSVMALD